MKIAVIMFPGNNCEEESARACIASGMEADILRWNTKEDLTRYDGFILPGGWSYEDRVRAGVIASKDPVMNIVREEADKGKPVLGICNGAQVLVESGMIPGIKNDLQMALAANINPFVSGFYCTWVRIKSGVDGARTAFTRLTGKEEVMHVPIAHGEGRFTTREDGLLKKLQENNQIVFRYCDKNGKVIDGFPVNPNGSMQNIAAICNPQGNVMSIMPHPERASWMRQVPGFEGKSFSEMDADGPGRKIFRSMKDYIEKEGESWK